MPLPHRDICTSCGRATDAAPCTECAEPRASVMPPHMPSVDPLFVHGVFNDFAPDDPAIKEKE